MQCGLRFMTEDHLEVHHRNDKHSDNALANLALLHGHCHDEVHRTKPALQSPSVLLGSAVEGYS